MEVISNQEIARVLAHIAEILSIRGENPFKIRAYHPCGFSKKNGRDNCRCGHPCRLG